MADMHKNRRTRRWITTMSCVIGCGLVACSAKDPCLSDDPRDVVKQYLQMLDAQNEAKALDCLTDEAQNALAQRAEAFNAVHADGKREPSEMLRAGHVIASTREYKKFEVQSEDESRAIVDIVMQDGSKIPVSLRRESARWAVELDITRIQTPSENSATPTGVEQTQTDKE